MQFVIILVVVFVIAAIALGFMPRGRRNRYDSVEERPPGRD